MMCQNKRKKDKLLPTIFILILVGLIGIVFMFLTITGTISLGNQGVSMDTQGNIYVGKDRQILVYDLAGNQLRTISPHTDRGYSFLIQEDVLYVSAHGRILAMDLTGTVLEEETDAVQRIPIVRKTTYTVGGRTFTVTRNELYYSVKEQLPSGTRTVLRESTGNVFFQILLLGDILALLATTARLVVLLQSRQDEHRRRTFCADKCNQ